MESDAEILNYCLQRHPRAERCGARNKVKGSENKCFKKRSCAGLRNLPGLRETGENATLKAGLLYFGFLNTVFI